MLDPSSLQSPDSIQDQVRLGPMSSHEDNTKHHADTQANLRLWVAKGLITFGDMPDASFDPIEIPARFKCLISVGTGLKAINSNKKGAEKVKFV
jgi:hypothetical protein